MHELPKGKYLIFKLCKITIFSKLLFWLNNYIFGSKLIPQTPAIYKENGNYLRFLQKFSDLSYEVYVWRYKLPNSSHFPPDLSLP